MNDLLKKIIGMQLCAVAGMLLVGCESEFASDPTRPMPTRAVESPQDVSSPNHEIMVQNPGTVPLVSVTLPNRPGENPQVRTIADNVHDTFTPPAATRPTSTGTETVTPPIHIDPISGK